MYKLFLLDKRVIVYDQSEKDFKHKYGSKYEQIAVVRDDANITVIANRMLKQYSATDVLYDCHIKKRWGWKYFTAEQKEEYRAKMSEAKKGRKLSNHQRVRISEGKTGKRGNHTGHRHSKDTKDIMSLRALGHKRITGRRWCYDLLTGKEYRVVELPKGCVWGRDPGKEYAKNFFVM